MEYTQLSNAESEEDYLKESVDILPEAIREEFVRLPADLAYWGAKYADSVRTYLLKEQAVKECRARNRLGLREQLTAAGKKHTEGDLDAWVEQTPEYQQCKLEEIEAEAAKLAAKVKMDAVMAKRDMVMSLGAHIRAEMGPTQLRDYNR